MLSLIEEMVANPAKFELLLSALQSMENSVKNARKSKGSLDANKSNRRNLKHKQSQGSIEGAHGELSQNSAVSLKLSESGEETPLGSKPPLLPNCTEEIYEYMAESIEIEYPYESDMIVGEKGDKGDKVSNAESEEIMQFSAARSI